MMAHWQEKEHWLEKEHVQDTINTEKDFFVQ